MFESFGVPSLCLANRATLALASSGRVTGLVVLSGHLISSVIYRKESFNIIRPHHLTLCSTVRGLPTESRHKDGQRGGTRHHGPLGEVAGRKGTPCWLHQGQGNCQEHQGKTLLCFKPLPGVCYQEIS